jgi:hypothetical protein
MRIVFFNMKHLRVENHQIQKAAKALKADAIIFAEAGEGMNRAVNNRAKDVELQHYCELKPFQNHRSDTTVVWSKEPVQVTIIEPEGQRVHAFNIDFGDGVEVVTFHAPYEGGTNGSAQTFVSKVFEKVEKLSKTPVIVMGDYNTYGKSVPGTKYQPLLSESKTTKGSKKDKDGALDKIAISTARIAERAELPFGRVQHEDYSPKLGAASASEQVNGLKDITLTGDDLKMFGLSDHFAIYVDFPKSGEPRSIAGAVEASSSSTQSGPPSLSGKSEEELRRELKAKKTEIRMLGGMPSQDGEVQRLTKAIDKIQQRESVAPVAASASSSTRPRTDSPVPMDEGD